MSTPQINQAKYSILITFHAILSKGGKNYCTPSAESLLELLQKYHKIKIQKSWMYDCIHQLIEGGYLLRQRRWRRDIAGRWDGKPSLVSFTFQGLRFLIQKGVEGARAALKALELWYRTKDNRFPAPYKAEIIDNQLPREENLKRLHDLLRGLEVVKPIA